MNLVTRQSYRDIVLSQSVLDFSPEFNESFSSDDDFDLTRHFCSVVSLNFIGVGHLLTRLFYGQFRIQTEVSLTYIIQSNLAISVISTTRYLELLTDWHITLATFAGYGLGSKRCIYSNS